MFTEIALTAGAYYGYKYLKDTKRKIKQVFYKIIEDYNIIDIKESEFGYSLIINLKNIGFEKLEASKSLLEASYGHKVYIIQNENLSTATVNVVTKRLSDNTKFIPRVTKPYEIYAGLSYKFTDLTSNLNKFPHILVSGQTGSGKTEIIRLILTNHIYNYSDRDINFYFSDLSDMCDFDIFRQCKQTKGYARTIGESKQLFEYILHIYSKRLEIFAKNNCKNIREYNERCHEKRMAYIYLVLDEFADYFPVNKFEDNYEGKVKCYNILKHIVRKVRKSGIFLIVGIQRPDTTVLDPSLRSGLCTKIGFSQNTNSSSLVVCDTTELTNIENRAGLFMMGNIRENFKSLYIDDNLIKKYIKNSIIYNKSNFNKFLKQENVKEQVKEETKQIPHSDTKTKKKTKSKVKIKK